MFKVQNSHLKRVSLANNHFCRKILRKIDIYYPKRCEFLSVLFIESSTLQMSTTPALHTQKKKKDVETKNIFFSYESGGLNHSKIISQRNLLLEIIRFKPTGGRTFSASFSEISPFP